MRPQGRTVEQVIASIASGAHGIVTWSEMLAHDISESEIKRRVKKGLLIRKHRGVFRVGHYAPSVEADYIAAVRACGKGAVLSGPAAAHLLGLVKGPPPPPDVTSPTERRIKGIRTRRCRRIDRRDVTRVHGIPVTSVARTLVDVAAEMSPSDLARAFHEAEVRYRTKPAHVEAALARVPNRPGARTLRAVLRGDVRAVLSELERAFLALLRQQGLPLPETNRPAGGHRVDCRWPRQRLTVELDSYRFHNSRHAWEKDRQREREARAREDNYRRYTWRDVVEDQRLLLTELRALLQSNPA
jgi:predicted transcriptional regulator of viral defense system